VIVALKEYLLKLGKLALSKIGTHLPEALAEMKNLLIGTYL
jgi:hypothetical protein